MKTYKNNIHCRYCGSDRTIKKGYGSSWPTYGCLDCYNIFSTNPFPGSRLEPSEVAAIFFLHKNFLIKPSEIAAGSNIRLPVVQRHLKNSHYEDIYNGISDCASKIAGFSNFLWRNDNAFLQEVHEWMERGAKKATRRLFQKIRSKNHYAKLWGQDTINDQILNLMNHTSGLLQQLNRKHQANFSISAEEAWLLIEAGNKILINLLHKGFSLEQLEQLPETEINQIIEKTDLTSINQEWAKVQQKKPSN